MTDKTATDLRSSAQNKRLWAMLNDISKQVPWPVWFEGRCDVVRMDSQSWKNVFTASLEKSQKMAQGLDGGYVLLGQRTSKMGVKKMAELIQLIEAFGAERGVIFNDPKSISFRQTYENL